MSHGIKKRGPGNGDDIISEPLSQRRLVCAKRSRQSGGCTRKRAQHDTRTCDDDVVSAAGTNLLRGDSHHLGVLQSGAAVQIACLLAQGT